MGLSVPPDVVMARAKKPALTRAQQRVVRDEAEAEAIHQARFGNYFTPAEARPPVPPVVAPAPAPPVDVVPESWVHWIYRQLTK